MSQQEAVTELFVAFAAQRNVEQAQLYLTELQLRTTCAECIEATCTELMRTSKRLPSLAQLLDECDTQLRSDNHGRHITLPQLAPTAENEYRTTGVELIKPRVNGNRDVASFIAAQMWWTHIALDSIVDELQLHPIWVSSARSFLEGKDVKQMTAAAFARARWAAEHPEDELMPDALLALEVTSA